MKSIVLLFVVAVSAFAQPPASYPPYNPPVTVVPQIWFGSAAPGIVQGNRPGDIFYNTAVSPATAYYCAATFGTRSPACSAVGNGNWQQFTAGSGGIPCTGTGVCIGGSASGQTALPAGTTATTPPLGDISTKVANMAALAAATSSIVGTYDEPANWYVDSINGSDSNSGKQQNLAFQTIAHMNAQTVVTGQVICLAANSVWHETLVITVNNVGVYGCGSGTKPLLDASDNIAAGTWIATGGQANVYESDNLPIQFDSSVTHINVWENNLFLPRATSLANCSATPGTYWVSSDTSTPITVYVHSADNSNPASNGKVYAYANRQMGLNASAQTGMAVKNVWTRRNAHDTGSLQVGNGSNVAYSLATDGSKHNLIVGENSIVSNTVAHNYYFAAAGGSTAFVGSTGSATAGSITFLDDSAIEDSYLLTVAGSLSDGFYAHAASGTKFSTVSYINDVSQGNATAFDSDSSNMVVDGAWTDGTINASADRSYIWNTIVYTAGARAISNSNSNAFLSIKNSNINDTGSFNIAIFGSSGIILNIDNSVIAGTGGYGLFLQGAPASLSLYNNTFTANFDFFNIGTTPVVFASNFNTFLSPGSGNKFTLNSTAYTFATYKSTFLQDAVAGPIGGQVMPNLQTNTLNVTSLPASAGSGGLFMCVDSAGVVYKKATCP